MTHETYLWLHILGVALILMALGGVILHAMGDGTRASPGRRIAAITHGTGLLIVLVAGFGMLARLGHMGGGLPGWVWAKLAIWLLLGAFLVLPNRVPRHAKAFWVLVPLLVTLAGWLAISKPF